MAAANSSALTRSRPQVSSSSSRAKAWGMVSQLSNLQLPPGSCQPLADEQHPVLVLDYGPGGIEAVSVYLGQLLEAGHLVLLLETGQQLGAQVGDTGRAAAKGRSTDEGQAVPGLLHRAEHSGASDAPGLARVDREEGGRRAAAADQQIPDPFDRSPAASAPGRRQDEDL